MGSLFLVKLQQEGKLQKGDEVMVDGNPGTIQCIRSMSEIVVDCGNTRIILSGLEGFGPCIFLH